MSRSRTPEPGRELQIALIGNPNAGKTSLFNQLTGLRAKTANFPGTTIETRVSRLALGGHNVRLVDLPGLYSLDATNSEEAVARHALSGEHNGDRRPDAVLLLVDATNLERSLYLASQVLELGLPAIVALSMVDIADREGTRIDADVLSTQLGCPVVPVVARNRRGVVALRERLESLVRELATHGEQAASPLACGGCSGCPFRDRYDWAEGVGKLCVERSPVAGSRTERIDRVLTHPVGGVAAFGGVMFAVFATIFWLAQYPMGWIDAGFARAGELVGRWAMHPELKSLLVDGVIGGLGGVLIFLPQICILFFMLSLIEDTGYLARAAFVMDRLMRRIGLPGKAFLPMLSAHACAVPAIMATRVIEDRRERLVTIFVLPLLTCSARIPVFAMVTALLFPRQPILAALVFTGAYTLGTVSALGTAFVLKRTLLPGETRPLVLELPGYKLPSLRNALLTMIDRARVFVVTAGTVILVLSMVLWVLATYPRSEPPAQAMTLLAQAERMESVGSTAQADELRAEAGKLTAQNGLSRSFAGRLGRLIEPTIRPLGFDWQIGIGLISSLAAREVIVSTMSIVYGVGSDADDTSLYKKLESAVRADGRRVFTPATSGSLLVFYVLAMQCMSTLATTRRETGGWRWPALQFGYMTVLAYVASFVCFQTLSALGFG
jgi:ferrous iron transport protein B